MSDGFLFLFVLAAALGLLYVWLREWWFAGVVVALAVFAAVLPAHGWAVAVWAGMLGFVPWGAWWSFTPKGREMWAGLAESPRDVRRKREAAEREAALTAEGIQFLPGTGLSPETIAKMRRQGLLT